MEMLKLYAWDDRGYYSHVTEVDPLGPLPERSTPTAPLGELARWNGQGGWEVVDKRDPEPVPPPVSAEYLAQRIADRRYQAQAAGTTLNGMPIDTSTDSQSLITGAALAAVLDSNYVCRWKMADGARVELDAKMIIAVASAVRDHIQACYDREDKLLTAVSDGTYTNAMLDEGWPA